MEFEGIRDAGREFPRNPRRVDTLIRLLIASNPRLRASYELYQLRGLWMGESNEYVRRATVEFIFRRGELTIVLNNPALRMEFNALREKIRAMFNEKMGYEVVTKLVFR